MYLKLVLLVTILACSEGALYSSFWAPLFDPRILNYRVDAAFDPEGGRVSREAYVKKYGVRGERLIADLGSGRAPADVSSSDDMSTGVVKFYYTYPGASQDSSHPNND